MSFAIVAEHIRRLPWHHGRWAVDIARGIAERAGHVTLICDAIEDRSQLESAGNITIIERAPGRGPRRRQPTRFQRWALDQLDATSADATLSLTRLVPAGLWLPVEPPSSAAFVRQVSSSSPPTVLLEAVSRPWILDAMSAERRARRIARSSSVQLARLGACGGSGSSSVLNLGLASTLDSGATPKGARYRLRERLGLADTRPVLLCSLVDRPVSAARALLEAIARSRRSAGPPALLILTREPIRVHRLASALGALTRVRILGASSQMDAILSACDALALPARSAHSTARLAADAIAMHTPVIAAEGAPGAELIEPASFGVPPFGQVLSDVTPGGWQGALDQMLEPSTLGRMRESAASLAPTVRFDSFIDRLLAAMTSPR